jgi:UPF0176 protein
MPVLHNLVNTEELRQRMLAETEPRTTVSFYKYFPIADPKAFRDDLFIKLNALKVFGRIYVAAEGINAQVSVPEGNFEAMRDALYGYEALSGVRLNIAVDDDGKSFWVLKIKVREKIVADGIDDPSFDLAKTGVHLKAKEFNEMAQREDVVIVDMRNHYEYEVGHFENAIEVPSDTFREQLPMAADMLKDAKDKPILMYCTGGIRCEKASAYMKLQGFENVYQLDGGIIEYTRQARAEGIPLLFKGKNFVFDGRMGERITEDVIAQCHQCGAACDTHVNCANDACHLLFIQCDTCKEQYKACCSNACAELLDKPAEMREGSRLQGIARMAKSRERLRLFRGQGLRSE